MTLGTGKLGLSLGGGGVIGVAWEIGVLQGLCDAGALDLDAVVAAVGTSAGSVVGSRLLNGATLEQLAAEQTEPDAVAGSLGAKALADPRPLMEIFGLWGGADPMSADVAVAIGAKAMAATTATEDEWIASFEKLVGTEWPARDMRVTAVSCTTGERAVWTSASGVSLARAVASSCAVPGLFPAVTIDGDRYTDGGVRSTGSADVLADSGATSVLFIGPMVGATGINRLGRLDLDREGALLEAKGITLHEVVPGAAFEAAGFNLMDPSRRADAVEIGRTEGKEAAARL